MTTPPLFKCPYCKFTADSDAAFVAHVGPVHAPGADPEAFAHWKRPWRASKVQRAAFWLAIGFGLVFLDFLSGVGAETAVTLLFIGCVFMAFVHDSADDD